MFSPLRWLPNQRIDEFSTNLAQDFAGRYSSEMASQPQDKKREQKLRKTLKYVFAQARAFHLEQGLGVYGKARLGNTFKWELKSLGYDDAFINEVTRGLILGLRGE